jgi:hypothetical protein
MNYLTMLSVAGLYNIECLDNGWMIIWKGPWFDQGTGPSFTLEDWEKPWKS